MKQKLKYQDRSLRLNVVELRSYSGSLNSSSQHAKRHEDLLRHSYVEDEISRECLKEDELRDHELRTALEQQNAFEMLIQELNHQEFALDRRRT
jgi:hypothetical protein